MENKWVVTLFAVVLMGTTYAEEFSVQRQISNTYIVDNGTINVKFVINSSQIPTLGVSSVNPANWGMTDVTCSGRQIKGNKIEWIFWDAGIHTGNMVCSYNLTASMSGLPSSTLYKEYNLDGQYFSASDDIRQISGPSQILVYRTKFKPMIDVINKWERSEVDLNYTVQYIINWFKT